MKKHTKIWLIIAASLVLIGSVAFVSVMTMLGWDFTKLSTVKYETNEYEIDEGYKNISIITDTADVVLVAGESSKTSVVCLEQNNVKHRVTVQDDTLVIEVDDTRKWYEYIVINFGTPKITVCIPQGKYGALSVRASTGDIDIPKDFSFKDVDISLSTGDVEFRASASDIIKIKASTGDIRIGNISAGALDLSVSTGRVKAFDVICKGDVKIDVSTGYTGMTDVECKSVISSGSTGTISLTRVIAQERFEIERSTGDVELGDSDAAEIYIKTDTGDVRGTLLSGKAFIVNTDTGKAFYPKETTGGRCEITTDTGDIIIDVIS